MRSLHGLRSTRHIPSCSHHLWTIRTRAPHSKHYANIDMHCNHNCSWLFQTQDECMHEVNLTKLNSHIFMSAESQTIVWYSETRYVTVTRAYDHTSNLVLTPYDCNCKQFTEICSNVVFRLARLETWQPWPSMHVVNVTGSMDWPIRIFNPTANVLILCTLDLI